jgi:hypothetical protein
MAMLKLFYHENDILTIKIETHAFLGARNYVFSF